MRHNPFKVVEEFEDAVAEYTEAPYAVAVDSCTNAIFLSMLYYKKMFLDDANYPAYISLPKIGIPKHTYLSVPMSVIHAGFEVKFVNNGWQGIYNLHPTPVWDAAKRLTSGMYLHGQFMCLSFHVKKTLPIGKGGMILCDDAGAVEWFKKARYEGRSAKPYKEDDVTSLGWNMYMAPEQAARGLTLLQNYPDHMPDQIEEGGYRDLTTFSVFKGM